MNAATDSHNKNIWLGKSKKQTFTIVDYLKYQLYHVPPLNGIIDVDVFRINHGESFLKRDYFAIRYQILRRMIPLYEI